MQHYLTCTLCDQEDQFSSLVIQLDPAMVYCKECGSRDWVDSVMGYHVSL